MSGQKCSRKSWQARKSSQKWRKNSCVVFSNISVLRTARFICWSKIKTFLQELENVSAGAKRYWACLGRRVLVMVKRRNQPVEEGKLCFPLDTCTVFWMIQPNMEAKRLVGLMKDSSIQEGSEKKEKRRSTKLFVEKKYCLRVEVFGSLAFPFPLLKTDWVNRMWGKNSL